MADCIHLNNDGFCNIFYDKEEGIINGCDDYGNCEIERYKYDSSNCEYFQDNISDIFVDDR